MVDLKIGNLANNPRAEQEPIKPMNFQNGQIIFKKGYLS